MAWNFRSRMDNSEYTEVPLMLGWYLDGTAVLSDNNLPEEEDARTLTLRWLSRLDESAVLPIRWHVESEAHAVMERAPFCLADPDDVEPRHFLHYFTWPVDAATGDLLQWMRLPVADQTWRVGVDRGKSGFIQEATGWKPGPLQQTLHVSALRAASML